MYTVADMPLAKIALSLYTDLSGYFSFREVKTRYEDTIMKTTVKMTLVKPAINGMEPDAPLYSEPVYVL